MNQSALPKLKQSNLAWLNEKINQFTRTRAWRWLSVLIEVVFVITMAFHTYIWARLTIEGTGGEWLPPVLLLLNVVFLALTARSFFKKV